MMIQPQSTSIGLSMEAVPAGRAMPEWLVKSLLSGRKLMVIHPTEAARKQVISSLLKQKNLFVFFLVFLILLYIIDQNLSAIFLGGGVEISSS